MAIVVEEGEKRGGSILGIVGWLVFLGIAGAAVYYLFFAQPELVTIPAAGGLSAIAPIAQVALHPETVVQGKAFQALTSTITPPTSEGPVAVGRSNPFVAP